MGMCGRRCKGSKGKGSVCVVFFSGIRHAKGKGSKRQGGACSL